MLFGNPPSDFGFLPPQLKSDCQIFLSTANAPQWQQWIKPNGVTMVHMICVGGGGGGGGGQSSVNNKGGGGGGGSGGISSLMIPAIFLPDRLSILVGFGGGGGAAATSGTTGNGSYIAFGSGITAGTAIPNLILSALGGSPGTAGNPGSGGNGGNIVGISALGPIGKMGIFPNLGTPTAAGISGQNGIAGASSTTLSAAGLTAVWNTSPLSGGGGGGGASNSAQGNGAPIVLTNPVDFANGNFQTSIAGGVGSSSGGGNGNSGYTSLKPFLNTGGTGGGSSSSNAGGIGGRGGYGCGGGGGGGGTTGGRGGNGGDGVVIITSW